MTKKSNCGVKIFLCYNNATGNNKVRTIMKAIRTKLGEGGRVNIPSHFRHDLHLSKGDDIILHIENNVIYITTPNQALYNLQEKVQALTNVNTSKNIKNISLVDELITMRRSENNNE